MLRVSLRWAPESSLSRRASAMLIEEARKRAAGGGDNLSLVIIKLNEVEPALGAPLGGAVRR